VSVSPRRSAALRRRLLAWYDAEARRLPWRFPQDRADPYRVWIAEVMLQQTRVRAVVPYYERFVARFPTLEALAGAEEDEVLAAWSGLGYYARGRNLLAGARAALARHGGLPASLEALAALPGVGPYTAGAVASIAFAIPAAAVDGNVARVLARLFALEGDPAAPAFARRAGDLARALVDPSRPGDLNQALMELGATVCARRSPSCARCPVSRACAARTAGRAAELPAPRRRAGPRPLVLAYAIVRRGDTLLLARRPPDGLFGGLWGPPAGEVPAGADAREALSRALLRDHGIRSRVDEELATCTRKLTHRALSLHAFRCEPASRVTAGEALRWASPREIPRLGVPSAVRALLARI
jgi:A/G-specific adenine glycosylase